MLCNGGRYHSRRTKCNDRFCRRSCDRTDNPEKLPQGFQRSEFLLEHGFVDRIVPRSEKKETIAQLLAFHHKKGGEA